MTSNNAYHLVRFCSRSRQQFLILLFANISVIDRQLYVSVVFCLTTQDARICFVVTAIAPITVGQSVCVCLCLPSSAAATLTAWPGTCHMATKDEKPSHPGPGLTEGSVSPSAWDLLTLWRPLLPYGYRFNIKHPTADRVKPAFVIFDIRALWRSGLSVRVPGCQKLRMTA